MAKIKYINARQILDSRGNPTIETNITLENQVSATASCPSGASVGTFEAVELRDHDQNVYKGMGVTNAVNNVNSIIAPRLIGIDAEKQQEIDRLMIDLDATPNKARLGANSILSVSMAVCKAAANSLSQPLFYYIHTLTRRDTEKPKIPAIIFNLINGGKHASSNVDFQEFHIVPASSKPFRESLRIGVLLFQTLKNVLKSNNLTSLIGDEGGYGPELKSNQEGFALLKRAIDESTLRLGYDVFFGLDAAANSFYSNKMYHIKDKAMGFTSDTLVAYYQELEKMFPLLYLEDPLAEEDWEGWVKITAQISQKTLIVGDDLTVTNPYRLQMALDKKAITGIIIKPNQIGTVVESLAVVEVAKQAGIKTIVSHRSGETNDDFIADFAVGVSADYAKFGAPSRGERVAKYNRLLEIEKIVESQSSQT